jgi:hypothetical protein
VHQAGDFRRAAILDHRAELVFDEVQYHAAARPARTAQPTAFDQALRQYFQPFHGIARRAPGIFRGFFEDRGALAGPGFSQDSRQRIEIVAEIEIEAERPDQ